MPTKPRACSRLPSDEDTDSSLDERGYRNRIGKVPPASRFDFILKDLILWFCQIIEISAVTNRSSSFLKWCVSVPIFWHSDNDLNKGMLFFKKTFSPRASI